MNFFDKYIDFIPKNNMIFTGLNDEFFSIYLSNLIKKSNNSILVVTNTLGEANDLYSSLCNHTDKAYIFPMDDFLTSEALAISPDLKLNRLSTLNSIISNEVVIIVTNLMGYLRYLPSRDLYFDSIVKLEIGKNIEPKILAEKLLNMGYISSTIVTKTGEIGIRSYIVDVFPIDFDNPIRIEFFDDEIESIRYFDPVSQKSLNSIESIDIFPNTEFLTNKEHNLDIINHQKFYFEYEQCFNISKFLSNPYVFYKDYSQILASYDELLETISEYRKEKDINYSGNYMFNLFEIKEKTKIFYNLIDNYNLQTDVINFNLKPIDLFYENVDYINNFLTKCINNNMTVVVALKNYQIRSFINSIKLKANIVTDDKILFGKVNVIEKNMGCGFIIDDLVVITGRELFSKVTTSKKYINSYKYSTAINNISSLELGDYVVHSVHGIGIYNGLKSLTLNGVTKDYLEVLYQGSDKIYIPAEKIEVLSKYSTKEGNIPKINRLGSSEWAKTKSRVRKKIRDIADELLRLYAERESRKGYAFSQDNELLLEFENDFPYTLTRDQKRSIDQIKQDMQSIKPMDRLLCGDVGFGKTEVAFVAAFKAILDSKQVLFLCPTTILSSQHYDNAINRFKNYPVNIALLNRFTTTKEKERILSGLEDGTIDFIIGTHRLLSDDIKLKDLGLLIIDEEQRFGVVHKEKLKKLKTNVDVLTLSATPIPRTLQMSLSGMRSLSLIETPPINRYPVQTYVIEQDFQIIKSAINKELSRNGQVFILYNKVDTIEDICNKISQLVPKARITFAHGRMSKEDLEKRIMSFIDCNYDVLVCTTIIETGIDIPNANTLIVFDSDRFGLSQLYQLRGRVGRSDKFAYAYFMYDSRKILTDVAKKRLNAITQFTELGSGFSIATRDLSIRGAGDIFGSEQAGFIDSVGIDLYLKILNEEINNNSDDLEEVEENKPSLINISTHISDNYVSDDDLKIEIHQKINSIDSKKKLNEIYEEIEDRFGKVPESLKIYMYEELFEYYAKVLNIKMVNQKKNCIELSIGNISDLKISIDDLFIEAYNVSKMFRFLSRGSGIVIVLDTIKLDLHPIYYLVELLEIIISKYYKN